MNKQQILEFLKEEIIRLVKNEGYTLTKYYVEIARKIKYDKLVDKKILFESCKTDIDYKIEEYLYKNKLIKEEE